MQTINTDAELIAMIDQAEALNRRHAAAIAADGAEDSAEAVRLNAELSRLVLAIRHTPAADLDGILRKADLYFHLTGELPRAAQEYRENVHPLDADLFGQSICNDLTLWAGHEPGARD